MREQFIGAIFEREIDNDEFKCKFCGLKVFPDEYIWGEAA